MKNAIPALLVALAIVAGSVLVAGAQTPPPSGPVFETYAVDTLLFPGEYTLGREVEQVLAGTICGEPFTKGKPGMQLVSLAVLMNARGKQGYRMVSYAEGLMIETPKDGHYTNEHWRSNVRIVWGK